MEVTKELNHEPHEPHEHNAKTDLSLCRLCTTKWTAECYETPKSAVNLKALSGAKQSSNYTACMDYFASLNALS